MLYNNLCEMKIEDIMSSLVSSGETAGETDCGGDEVEHGTATIPVQPSDNVGQFGNQPDIILKKCEDGGLEINTKNLATKISSEVFEAIKKLIKGDE